MRAGVLLAAFGFAGCESIQSVLAFEKQLERAKGFAEISGTVTTEAEAEGPLIVILARVSETDGLVGVDSFVRVRPGRFEFHVDPGRYQLGAYEDGNENGRLDPGERTRAILAGPILEASPGESVSEDIVLAASATSPPGLTESVDVLGIVARTPREQARFSLWSGSIQGEICSDLSDPRFDSASGHRGLWEVTDFLIEGIAGIYFLEPYDPERIPVLFVHGIGGTPRQFSALSERLDRSRFQPWFYFYPSGFPLDDLATHLAFLLSRMQVTHGFDEVAFVAHSMGGLVSRGAILKYADETRRADVRFLATISTPWAGATSAALAEDAPIALPQVFTDMSPSSEYLRWLFYEGTGRRTPRTLPEGAEFHMLFGFRMNEPSKTANDGTVSVASHARPEAQSGATTVRAFDYGHAEILGAPEVSQRLNLLLAGRFR